jgi:hypothetical protein
VRRAKSEQSLKCRLGCLSAIMTEDELVAMLQDNHGTHPHQRTVVGTVGGWSGKPAAASGHATNGGLLIQADKREMTKIPINKSRIFRDFLVYCYAIKHAKQIDLKPSS